MNYACRYSYVTQSAVFVFFSSYFGPSGGSYGVIANSRIRRRPSSHYEMEINECENEFTSRHIKIYS